MSKVEVNQISSQCGSTLTIGQSGDTVQLASGATQTGFGRTGTVNWDTTKKTASFTAVSGNGYFIDTSSSQITVTLPASPSAGDIVAIADYTNTFETNNVTVARNSEKIGGIASDAILGTNGLSVTFVYVDSTEGWKNVQDATSNVTGNVYMAASGGTITNCGNDKIHTFTSPGTFTVSKLACCSANNEVSYVVVAGGGGGGSCEGGGGGGAGGYRETKSPVTTYTASPKCGYSTPGNRITVTATSFPITVGGGGTGGPTPDNIGGTGSNSVFSTITSAGGGGGSGHPYPASGANGGSGGGGGARGGSPGGSGNTPPVTPTQGSNGGNAAPSSSPPSVDAGGGGGGATANGSNASNNSGGYGGAGANSCITGSPVGRSGGGGGGNESSCTTGTATHGGGAGGHGPATAATAGTTNTGGGGGGGGVPSPSSQGAAGGSGVVIIRYRFK